MSKSYIPAKESELGPWSANFSSRVTSTPTAFGLTAGQATTYSGLNTAWQSAYSAAITPSTRTQGTVAAKNVAKVALIAGARELAQIVQRFPAITPSQLIDLGLTVRDVSPSPINPPTEPPVIEVVSVIGRDVKLRLHSLDTEKRGKPDGVTGASIFSFLGAAPPTGLTGWKFEGSTTRTTAELEFPESTPAGAQVWFTAFWFNPRSQSGPAANPITDFLGGGVAMAA